ncbi:putative mitochondrial pyruvate carrier [Helianthus annuus]|nr:putative mitochondrial pyruvate carrier [Helianthus annuus]
MVSFLAFLNSPVGPNTTHFWGPVANCGFVVAGLLCVYSGLFMRFAWMVQPRNYLLLVCHASNETVQTYQFSRWLKHQGFRRRGCSSTVPKSAKSWYVKNQKQESMVVDDAFSSKWRCSAKHKTFP